MQTFLYLSILFIVSGFTCISQSVKVGDIPVPAGYERIEYEPNSFGSYLREIRLKKENTVYLYNGQKKANQAVHFAVLNISVGKRDLQQCADAVMRLRAEYLKLQKKPICFIDNSFKKYCWSDYQKSNWQTYLETVFGMCGTLSLQSQLQTTSWLKLKAGDVIIKGGSPGHAVIIIDVARNIRTGDLIFLLAQSYMPAQDIHILLNENDQSLSPWYRVPLTPFLQTPQWSFKSDQLRTWP